MGKIFLNGIDYSAPSGVGSAYDTKDCTISFSQAGTRQNIASGEKHSTLMGKIAKFFADLKTVAFTGSYSDLTNKPSIPAAVRVKGNAESSYRTGDVNLTPANIGAYPQFFVTTATNFDTVRTTGLYHIKISGCTGLPTSNWGTVIVDWEVGTKYQMFIPDGEVAAVYKRKGDATSWGNWINLLSWGNITNKPTIPAAVAVKGNAESTYRTGNVNLTPANIGAVATSKVLTTKEQINANTDASNVAGATAVKAMVSEINSNLGEIYSNFFEINDAGIWVPKGTYIFTLNYSIKAPGTPGVMLWNFTDGTSFEFADLPISDGKTVRGTITRIVRTSDSKHIGVHCEGALTSIEASITAVKLIG